MVSGKALHFSTLCRSCKLKFGLRRSDSWRELGLATWKKKTDWPHGGSLEGLESRAIMFEGIS